MTNKTLFPDYNDVANDIYIQYIENSQRTEKPHIHHFFQVFFLIKGKLTHHINGLSADMAIGEMAIIPPNVLHCISLEDDPLLYSFSFNLSTFGEINFLNEQVVTFLKSLQDIKKPLLPKTSIADDDILYVQSLFERIYRESNKKEAGFKEAIIVCAILLITQFIRRYNITNPNFSRNGSYTNEQMVLTCIKYIDNHFAENLNLDKMSHMSALSQSTFCCCFKKITGTTFHTYLNQCRINHAINLIKKGYKITAISSFCGYDDFVTFSRNFKKFVGTTPREYQKIKQLTSRQVIL